MIFGHSPRRTAASQRGMSRTSDSSSAIAWSATDEALTPAPLVTVMPRFAAACRSTCSYPAPITQMILRLGRAAISSAYSPNGPRVRTASICPAWWAMASARSAGVGARIR
ncbi:hypothetical protein D9M69_522790 [compost metagenome]